MIPDDKYNEITPTKDYILDEVILLNAWKKAHQYIRNHNWYVDFFSLDISTIKLDKILKKLIENLENKKLNFTDLELVPAPKSDEWIFTEKRWEPADKSKSGNIPLRPLAHVSIEEQILLTAVVMLLANETETLQGDPSSDFNEVHGKKVISYGNRLHCIYINDKANFSWGNSIIYSKYFTDYQKFLARPIYFGQEAKKLKTTNEEIYEIHLDFAKFYDTIDRKLLTEKISSIIKKITKEEPDETIKSILDSFESWKWSEDSQSLFEDVCATGNFNPLTEEKGIPQGLVASGFFSNIYLLGFDDKLHELIGKTLDEEKGITLIDACRYVDDLRLIIKTSSKDVSHKMLKESIHSVIEDKIKDLGLKIQQKKTRIKKFTYTQGSISTNIADMQFKMSGPMPMSELDEQLGHLEGLIELSDNLSNELELPHENKLASIDQKFNDMRKDTLLRFSANRIHNLLKQKRNLVSHDINKDGYLIPGNWDYLQERMARKFISKWAKDPSLVLLLKKGLELFPSVYLLEPIIDNLEEKVCDKNNKQIKIFAEYCLGEIFRHAATVIHVKDKREFPAHSNHEYFFSFLEDYAKRKLKNAKEYTDSFRCQIRFFCLVRNISLSDLELSNNHHTEIMISRFINGDENVKFKDDLLTEISAAIQLANQIAFDKKKVIKTIINVINIEFDNGNEKVKIKIKQILDEIYRNEPALFRTIYLKGKERKHKWIASMKAEANHLGLIDNISIDDLSIFKGKEISLLSVIRSNNSPFKHENGILKLLTVILNDVQIGELKPIDIANSKVVCDDWNNILDLSSSCVLKVTPTYSDSQELFNIPTWLTPNDKPLYFIGMLIRSCLLGDVDWCSDGYVLPEESRYQGITSNVIKRQITMVHSPEFFDGAKASMSNWLSSLLYKLLRWPGISLNQDYYKWPNKWNLAELKKCIDDRVLVQKNYFCNLTNIPTYIEKVDLGWDKEKTDLNILMVQPVLPLVDDFTNYDLKLSTSKYRSKHRHHLTKISELILHHIACVDSKYEKPKLKGKVDLIIWPELSVSMDDMDVLERLVDKTGAIVFAGITFDNIINKNELNNAGLWVIPNKKQSGRRFIKRLQGKWHMTSVEKSQGIVPWRPYQLIIELIHPSFKNNQGFKLTSSICYDATDIKLNADLRDKTDAYIIAALNKDVATFDSMVDALYYHMYQPVILVNSGEFGGSVAKAPYKEKYNKLISHVHGCNQVSISSFELNMFDFKGKSKNLKSGKEIKTPPAGYQTKS